MENVGLSPASSPVGLVSTENLKPKHVCSGEHKTRLLVGEGNFSFALAMVRKHDRAHKHSGKESLARSIIATEYKSVLRCGACEVLESMAHLDLSGNESEEDGAEPAPLLCDDCSSATKRMERLKKKGAEVILGVDGTKLHEVSALKGRTFDRIHWNCPHDGSSFMEQTLPKIIEAFFVSCAKMQKSGGRIHITLAQPNEGKNGFYQSYVYNIMRAACSGRYVLVKKRKFSAERYPGYTHTQTKVGSKAGVTDKGMREFVFKRIRSKERSAAFEKAKNPKGKVYMPQLVRELQEFSDKTCKVASKVVYGESRTFYACSSDSDSSSYEEE